MSIARKLFSAAAPLALLAVGACAAPFSANVSRFQQLPAPQGQTFRVVASDPKLEGGLEFSQYASLVADRLEQVGYVAAPVGTPADLRVTLDYDVDNGRERVRSSPGFGYAGYGRFSPWGWHYPYGWSRAGYIYGWHDPFLWGPGYTDIESYTVYTSELDMKIERAADGQRLFEGSAEAVSRTNKLTYLVPNLVDAMFTGFPGNTGETVRITVRPEDERR